MNREQFIRALQEKGIDLTDHQMKLFDIYYQILVKWNTKVNLTAIIDEEEVYLKHFYDSITAAFYFDFEKNVQLCDIGAGAGFPSIPLKICYPKIKVTIVDSLRKRINFLDMLTTELDLENVSLFHHRAEDFGQNKQHREKYDVVMARAVARMSVLSELCLPLVKKHGTFIAMKGSRVEEELSDASKAIKTLGGQVNTIELFTLPNENSERSVIIIDKQKSSPKKYPRKAGTPNKNPIS